MSPPAGPNHEHHGAVEEPLLNSGNALRWWGVPPLLLALLGAVLVMASPLSPRLGVPLGLLFSAFASAAALYTLGSFDDGLSGHQTITEGGALADDSAGSDLRRPPSRLWQHCQRKVLFQPMLAAIASAVALWLSLRTAVAGHLSMWTSAALIPISFMLLVVAVYRLGERLGPWQRDEDGAPRPLTRRHGFWLVLITTVLQLPMLGSHSLIDPWEPHYGEVAREILAREDWISLWWAQDGWFWSKPVLSFWLQAGSMALLGVRYEPGEMLANAAMGATPQPEWALRFPVFLFMLLGVYFLYKGVARSHGRGAGLLGGLVLLSMPQFFLIAQQSMTDMPFVASMCAAMGLFWYGIQLDPREQVVRYSVRCCGRPWRLSLFQLVFAAVLMWVLPQICYLLSRNVGWFGAQPVALALADTFRSGSPSNCGLPGNVACRAGLTPAVARLQPAAQAINWILALALLLWLSWGERRRQRLVFIAAWMFVALATMAKGVAGIGLPVLAALAYVVASRRYRDLARMEIAAGLLLFVCMVLPWFVAMYARHGQPFVDRLLFHDMFKRAFRHVHDTNSGVDTSFRYYVWQLGYATFPWTGLVPLGLLHWLIPAGDSPRAWRRYGGALLMASWFFIGFMLFSVMGTKFHHYSLPLVPPLAMLVGMVLHQLWQNKQCHGERLRLIAASCVAAGLVTSLVGRDLWMTIGERPNQQRLMQLFTYNYTRSWPPSLDYRASLLLFSLVCAVCTGALAVRRMRRQALVLSLLTGLVFAGWGVDVYLLNASPHWGQRELYLRYEAERLKRPGRLVAYQLNWKGENFYRGNAVAAFVASGKPFIEWIKKRRAAGERTFYFVTEHRRSHTLRRELGKPAQFEKLTDVVLNNKFLLIRVQFAPADPAAKTHLPASSNDDD